RETKSLDGREHKKNAVPIIEPPIRTADWKRSSVADNGRTKETHKFWTNKRTHFGFEEEAGKMTGKKLQRCFISSRPSSSPQFKTCQGAGPLSHCSDYMTRDTDNKSTDGVSKMLV
ncbi:hypothetical protein IRJ41_018020, partial [Triplophysa rosa]